MLRREFLAAAASAAAGHTNDQPYVQVSRRDRRYFELSNGTPYIPVGLNLIAPPGPAGFDTFTSWLDRLAENGGNYIRVWLSDPYWEVEHEASGRYDAARAERIRRMLGLCGERGIRVKMTIEHFRSIGEPPVRQRWADKPMHLRAHGGPAASIADFFDGEPAREQFRRKIRWYAERFGSDPAIYGWELWNEINAVRGGDYLAWTEAMLPHLHAAFPKNLCMQSLGSFDSDDVRDIYRQHSTMRGNDVAQVHRYLDLGAALAVCRGPVDVLAADAVRELLRFAPGRPVVLAESGAVQPNHSGPFRLYRTDSEGVILHDVLFAPFFSGAAGPGQIWHWDSYVAANNLWHHYSRFATAVQGIDPAREGFEPFFEERSGLRVYGLRGSKTSLLWLRDGRSDWRSELEQRQPPATVRVGPELGPLFRGRRVRAYDPWKDRWSELEAGSQPRVPEFTRSLVIRLDL